MPVIPKQQLMRNANIFHRITSMPYSDTLGNPSCKENTFNSSSSPATQIITPHLLSLHITFSNSGVQQS
jgi:hypothetical protein